MKNELPKRTSDEMDELIAKVGEKISTGEIKDALKLYLKAWDLMPDPKAQWDYYPQVMSGGLVHLYRDLKNFKSAKKWISVMREAYAPANEASDDSIGFLEGTVFYEAGEFDSAFEKFDSLYRKYKKKFFGKGREKYLEFYLDRKKA